MDRRSLLKSSVIIAAASQVVANADAGEKSLLADYFSEYRKVHASLQAVWEKLEKYHDDDIPQTAVHLKEVSRNYSVTGLREIFYSKRDITEFFDSHLQHVELWRDVYGEEACRNKRARIENDRQATTALWQERWQSFEDWRQSSGYADLERVEMRLLKEEDRLDDLIMDWQAQNLDEVRIKSQYVLLAYEGALGHETAKRFLSSVGGKIAA